MNAWWLVVPPTLILYAVLFFALWRDMQQDKRSPR